MIRTRSSKIASAALLAICLLIPAGWVVAGQSSADFVLLILGITEGPDPIEGFAERYVDLPQGIANPGGVARGDGRIDLAFSSAGHHAIAVWAYGTDSGHDIAFREWDGIKWRNQELISADPKVELDPRAFIEADGTIWVTWWVDQGSGKIMVSRRDPVSRSWDGPAAIAGGGRKPSIIVHDGWLLVTFERRDPNRTKLMLSSQSVTEQQSIEILAETQWIDGSIEPLLHSFEGRLWIDWQHSDTLFGYSEFVDGQWVVPGADLPWTARSWSEQVSRSVQDGATDR